MPVFEFNTFIAIEADDYDSAISWFDAQLSLTTLKEIYVAEIEEK